MRGGRLIVRVPREKPFQEYFLTGCADGLGSLESAQRIFSKLAQVLAQRRVQPLSERIYGLGRARRRILEMRSRALRTWGLESALPFTYIEGRPSDRREWSGIQVWGVGREGEEGAPVASVACPNGIRGRLWTRPEFRLLHISSVHGAAPGARIPLKPAAQARRMFLNARRALSAQGFRYAEVIRTWIYIRRILEWYGQFNGVRNALYARPDFFGGNVRIFPASTGIQGHSLDEECNMDVLAFSPLDNSRARPILKSGRQGPAFSYGSAFSRAVSLPIAGRRVLHVSGTASIAPTGENLCEGNPEGQSLQAIDNIAAILRENGAGLKDICSATVFYKSEKALQACRKAMSRLGAPLPAVTVPADVCRPGLQVEIEAVALP
ncbi:MAG: hypothetical protein A3J74_06760 [Elusimicrobia bacterium RIFCSPHIGHO2_02_FULL_57_9]|nr:MAG: hypothetical protein A3J74_06760 [Elusimicrobia bacterium RIFCSPHIGHO2_02_FULL_57_9]